MAFQNGLLTLVDGLQHMSACHAHLTLDMGVKRLAGCRVGRISLYGDLAIRFTNLPDA
jgi:hypothetical protein